MLVYNKIEEPICGRALERNKRRTSRDELEIGDDRLGRLETSMFLYSLNTKLTDLLCNSRY